MRDSHVTEQLTYQGSSRADAMTAYHAHAMTAMADRSLVPVGEQWFGDQRVTVSYDHVARDVVIAARQGILRLGYVDAVGRPRPRCPTCDSAQPPGLDRCPTCGRRVNHGRVPAAVIIAAIILTPVVLLVALALAVVLPGGGQVQTLSFGTGGSGCDLANVTSSFPRGQQIRTVVSFSPPARAGATITMSIAHDGTELLEHRQTFEVDQTANCLWKTLPALEPGHYQVAFAVSPSSLPPISGQFDVTPSDLPSTANDIPPVGEVWFGDAVDPQFYAVEGRRTTGRLSQETAVIGHFPHLPAQRVDFELAAGTRVVFEDTWPFDAPFEFVWFEFTPAGVGVEPGNYTARFRDADGNELASGRLTVTR